jgi:hypothetical protein
MSRRLGLLLVAFALAACASSSSQARQPSPSPTSPSPSATQPSAAPEPAPGSPAATPAPPPPSACRDPHEHVYNPDRLRLIDPCMTITGTVEVIRNEADGDYHILLRLDPAFANLVNNANISSQHGDLVLEPVCEIRVSQRDAVQACSGVTPTVPRPAIGTHYTAIGSYVLDQQHGWMELHPLWDLHAS